MFARLSLPVALVLLSALAPYPADRLHAQDDAGIRSWTSDRRDFREGDVVTVLVDEYTLASADQRNSALDSRRRDASVGAGQDITTSIPRSVGAEYGSINVGESRRRGEAVNQTRFRSEVSVRVDEVEPSGLLRVSGRRLVSLDGSEQEVRLSGWVRPQDISAGNVVESWRVGDVELVYDGDGRLSRPRQGIISRIVGWLWP